MSELTYPNADSFEARCDVIKLWCHENRQEPIHGHRLHLDDTIYHSISLDETDSVEELVCEIKQTIEDMASDPAYYGIDGPIMSHDVMEVWNNHENECEEAYFEVFGDFSECSSVAEIISISVELFVRREAANALYDMRENLENLRAQLEELEV